MSLGSSVFSRLRVPNSEKFIHRSFTLISPSKNRSTVSQIKSQVMCVVQQVGTYYAQFTFTWCLNINCTLQW